MDIMYLFSLFTYFRGFVVYSFGRDHFLVILLSLEFITLGIFVGLFFIINFYTINLFFLIIYLTMAVCEGALGLSIIVMTIRSVGNENVLSINILW